MMSLISLARLTRTLRAKLRRVRSNLGLAADLPLLHFASIGDVERVRLALASGRYSLQELDEGLRAAAAGGHLNVIIALHQGGLSLDRRAMITFRWPPAAAARNPSSSSCDTCTRMG